MFRPLTQHVEIVGFFPNCRVCLLRADDIRPCMTLFSIEGRMCKPWISPEK